MKDFKYCPACPALLGELSCPCLDRLIPSMYDGSRVSRNNPLLYSDRPDSMTASEVPVFNTMSTEEERRRMRAKLTSHGARLKPLDIEFFIDRVLFHDTFKTLAERYKLQSARAAKRKYDTIKLYLKETFNGK